MGRTTDNEENIEGFYDGLASHYDAMTGFEKRFAAERPRFQGFVQRFGITSAVDAGCGTGFHSILLSQLGVHVIGVDLSAEMLERAEANAQAAGVNIRFMRTSFEDLAEEVDDTVNGVLCVGNSFVHLPDAEAVERSLGSFYRVLSPNGVLCLQILNYDRILAERTRIQSITASEGTTYVRFYDFEPDGLTFNILAFDQKQGSIQHQLQSVKLNPLRLDDLRVAFLRAGLKEIEAFGSMALDPFDPAGSRDLVLTARKPG
jgi:SAM-dependent methyltransferase